MLPQCLWLNTSENSEGLVVSWCVFDQLRPAATTATGWVAKGRLEVDNFSMIAPGRFLPVAMDAFQTTRICRSLHVPLS